MILAAVTIGFESNGPVASSTAALLALAAQTSTEGTACSRLSWPVVLPGRPHGPTILASLAWLSLYSPTPPVILGRQQHHTADKQVTLVPTLRGK